MSWILLLVSLATGLLGSPGAPGPSDDHPLADGAVLVATYSQSDHPTLPTRGVPASLVVDTKAARSTLERRLGPHADTSALDRVDLDTHVLVAGGYHRCTEGSRVVADGARLLLEVVTPDEQVDCAWSPFTVDVHAVPR